MRWMRPLLTLACIAAILTGLFSSLEFSRPDRGKGSWEEIPTLKDRDDLNLMVVVIDTMRADRLSAYGYERPTSPILKTVAESGIRFDNVLAQSTWTKTSMASLLTATYPAKNRITRFNHVVPSGATLPSEVLQKVGFKTVGFWRNLWVGPEFGFGQGYELYVKPLGKPQPDVAHNPSAGKLSGTDETIIDAALQFLRSVGDQRFYLYVHLMDLHQYVYSDGVDFGTSYSDIYDQAIHFTDANLGTLFAVLQRQGLFKRTVVAVVSDHGEAFYEHGLDGHAKDLYNETTRVPFVITLPFRLQEPIVVRTPVENIDVIPTLFDLMGLPEMPEADGRSLVPLILEAAAGNEGDSVDGPRFAQLDQNWGRPQYDPKPLILIDEAGYRMHAPFEKPAELYEPDDSAEGNDVAEAHPERVQQLAEQIGRYRAAREPAWGGPGWVEVNQMDARQLRALGYAFDPHAPPEQRELKQ